MDSIYGKKYCDVKLKRNDKVVTLASVLNSVCPKARKPIEPLALFQRMSLIKTSNKQLRDFLKYELAPYPLSLFEDGLMRKTQKSALYKVFKEVDDVNSQNDRYYIIDGGYLLHKVVWPTNQQNFLSICDRYYQFIINHYPNCLIIFDGYDETVSLKSSE